MKKDKEEEEFWPRLLKDKALEKNQVKIDWDRYVDEDEEEEGFDTTAVSFIFLFILTVVFVLFYYYYIMSILRILIATHSPHSRSTINLKHSSTAVWTWVQ